MSATTAFAKIKSVDEVGLDTNSDLLTQWVTREFTKGRAAHQRFLDKGHRVNKSAWSEPFAAGFAFDEAWVADPADPWLDEANAAVLAESYVATIAARRSEATAAASALIGDSAKSSMHPLLAHYESDALLDAMATVAQYGGWSATHGFQPNIVHDLKADGHRIAKASNMDDAWGYDEVIDALHAKIKAKHVLTRGRVSLQFEINSDSELYGDRLQWEVGCPEIVFMAMGQHTAAYARGEKVWALYFTPSVNLVPDKRTGEMLPRSGWFNAKGWAGVCKTFDDYESAKEAAAELGAAVRTIRELSLIHISEPTRPY